jgi:hypothetical protein
MQLSFATTRASAGSARIRGTFDTVLGARRQTLVWLSAVAWIAACGDDGTDGLASCPEGKLDLNTMGVLVCADLSKPRAGSGAAGAKAGAAGSKSTASNTQANTGTKAAGTGSSAGGPPAASSGTPPAASSGGGNGSGSGSGSASTPAIPNGPWSCIQYMDACSCVPMDGLGDGCAKPRPTCCTLVTMSAKVVGCVCAPPDSAQCDGMKADPANFPSVSQCPPK